MKALTLWQPWASAIAVNFKTVETRSWHTNYRGELLIHSAKRRPTSVEIEFARDWGIVELPLGVAIAKCQLVDCIRMCDRYIESQTNANLEWGLWEAGRFAWVLRDIQLMPSIPMMGHQGLWNASLFNSQEQPKPARILSLSQASKQLSFFEKL